MVRSSVRAAAVITLAALFTGTATSAFGATPAEEVTPPTPIDSPTGSYIVLLDEEPVAAYEGGERGLAPTKPEEGAKLDPQSDDAKRYSAFLEERQQDVAAEAGIEPQTTYQVTLNGFSATMSPEEAARVSASKGVKAVYPDEIRHPDAVPSTQFLGLEGSGGVWEGVGGIAEAGKGVVVGVIDTGIAPENPSFAGSPLEVEGEQAPGDPFLRGNSVVFPKADGNEFVSARVEGEDWTLDAYSTKLVGAKYFSAGAARTGFDFGPDYLSPRDGDGHGSHTASTAAGNNGVAASVSGTDFGLISGVAPAAKVASYKACYNGPDPLVTTDDICALSDLLGAIDTATKDGVDVINYSIGGGAATSVWAADDFAFFNAAQAGVFVSVSAGNDGPEYSTADHASPWYTTVAASTIPTYEGTVEWNGQQAVGASVSVPFGTRITGEVVYAGDAAAAGATVADAGLCFLDSLDPAKVTGKIVVCDRGTNARVEKSQEVAAKGGVGMILVNVTPGSLDNDFHSVPTVHIDAQYRDDLLAYVRSTPGATATLIGENVTGIVTPTPVIAGFSSRGPMLADGSDILKPDVTAPGVAILAAASNGPAEAPTFEFLSGTSMSSPHVAGLGALYLGERPTATPAEVKSALMTTAYDSVGADGTVDQDPFAQGAGHVDPTKYFTAGLLYLNGVREWAGFVQKLGLNDFGLPEEDEIDGSDLNLASIAIGTLSKKQTVTRTVTATTAGTYTASASIPGMDVAVEPSSFTVAAGETQTFTVTFDNIDAPVEEWATGFLTWNGDNGISVRSPLAIRPVTADAPAEVTGTGITGSTPVTIDPGVTGELPLNLTGLAPVELLEDPGNPVPGHSGDQASGDENGDVAFLVDVPEGASLGQWKLDSSDDAGSDLDLYVYHVVSPDDLRYYTQWTSATGSADEQVTIDDPEAGTYLVVANLFDTPNAMTWDLTSAVVTPNGEGSFTATPNPLPVVKGVPTTYDLSWSGLQPETTYLGVVRYGESSVRTLLTVDAGAVPPAATVAPTISGTPKVGRTLTADPGTWEPADVQLRYQWLRDGAPIEGATSATYRVTRADVGTALSVQVTATQPGNVNAGVAVSNSLFVKVASTTKVTVNRYVGSSSQDWSVTVAVRSADGSPVTGAVELWVDSTKYTGTLADGSVTFALPKPSRGVHVVVGAYTGSDTVEASAGISGFLVRR